MVLLSGTRNTGGESRGNKVNVEVHPSQNVGNSNCLVEEANEQDVEDFAPGDEDVAWPGTTDPLPQLLAVVPSMENRINRSDQDEECEEYDDLSDLPDTRSIASDDSFYPPDIETRRSWLHGQESDDDDDDGCQGFDAESFRSWESTESPEPLTLIKACSTNNAIVLKALMRQGLAEEEVCETDRNNRRRCSHVFSMSTTIWDLHCDRRECKQRRRVLLAVLTVCGQGTITFSIKWHINLSIK
ncbi:hypothetical protein XELAEV_18031367mg [Xenopus laevis]|uniref:Uncharacterized protein n=1 Tax=Xenopus laevis TaxID=8355 RepID=A0A974HFL8_XENLA|nr:hypothetical protein XELAEV_18031367mg [Xenopus laevis]